MHSCWNLAGVSDAIAEHLTAIRPFEAHPGALDRAATLIINSLLEGNNVLCYRRAVAIGGVPP